MTVLGNVKLLQKTFAPEFSVGPRTLTLPSQHSGKGAFHALVWLQKGPAPLLVIQSGLFADLATSEGFTAEHLLWFHRRGYHVLVLPTIGGRASLDDQSKVLPFDLRAVGGLELELLRTAIREIRPHRIRDVHLIGLSYGGLIATVMAGLDAASPRPLLATTTSFSPVYDAREAIRLLDQGIEATSSPDFDRCKDIFGNLFEYASLLGTKLEGDMPEVVRNCAPWMIALAGYQGVLKKHIEGLRANRDFFKSRVSFSGRNGWSFEQIAANPTFGDYALHISGDRGIDVAAGEHLLPYWAAMARRHAGVEKVRVLTSADEILASAPEWRTNAFHRFTDADLIELPWGGHGGHEFYSAWYEGLLERLYPKFDGGPASRRRQLTDSTSDWTP